MLTNALDGSDELPHWFEVEPRDLFSRHGFNDGDALREVREWILGSEGLVVRSVDLLAAVIEELVLPRLDPEPLIDVVGGCRNPVRAVSGDGDPLPASQAPATWPKTLHVRRADILELARAMAEPATAGDLADWADRWNLDAA